MNTAPHTSTELSYGHEVNYRGIALFGDDEILHRKWAFRLKAAGFDHVSTFHATTHFFDFPRNQRIDLCIVDASTEQGAMNWRSCIEFCRFRGYTGKIVLTVETATPDFVYAAMQSGADDIWIKGPYLKLPSEVDRILSRSDRSRSNTVEADVISTLGLFRTVGLSEREITLLMEWAKGFPRQRVVAENVGISSSYTHKIFSRIYDKLTSPLGIDNPAQLAHLLTICILV